MTLYHRRKHTSLLNVQDRYYHHNLTNNHHSNQEKNRHVPHMIGLHVNNLDLHDTSNSSYGWQRHSDKIGQLTAAPDIVYRYTYLEKSKREKSEKTNQFHSKLNNSFSYSCLELSKQKYSTQQSQTIYDYIRQSIREIEQQRNMKQQNLSIRVQRPQNEDSTFRRVLGEKKPSPRTSLSRSTSTTTTTTRSSSFNNDFKNRQNLVNYINYSRVPKLTTPNQSYEQRQQQTASSVLS